MCTPPHNVCNSHDEVVKSSNDSTKSSALSKSGGNGRAVSGPIVVCGEEMLEPKSRPDVPLIIARVSHRVRELVVELFLAAWNFWKVCGSVHDRAFGIWGIAGSGQLRECSHSLLTTSNLPRPLTCFISLSLVSFPCRMSRNDVLKQRR